MPVRYSVYALALGTLIAHFVLTLIFVLPPNPIKTLTDLPQRYIGRFFYQDWGLFAPHPIRMDIRVLISCLTGDHESPPFDITRNLLKRRYLNGYDRVNRVAINYAYSFFTPYRSQMPYLELCTQKPDHPTCKAFRITEKRRREAAKEGLKRVATAFCADISKAEALRYAKAHIWILLSEVPPWSERYSGGRKDSVIDVGMVELGKSRPFGIWRKP